MLDKMNIVSMTTGEVSSGGALGSVHRSSREGSHRDRAKS